MRMSTNKHDKGVVDQEKFSQAFQNNSEVNSWMGLNQKDRRGMRWLKSYQKSYEICAGEEYSSEDLENRVLVVFYERLHSVRKIFGIMI